MGNKCCQSPENSIILQSQYVYCERCYKKQIIKTPGRMLFNNISRDKMKSVLVFMCRFGHIYEFQCDSTYCKFIIEDYNRKIIPSAPVIAIAEFIDVNFSDDK
jgi:hypothetical protein